MNIFNSVITGYSLLLLVGGVIGYFAAGSIASLLMSTIFAIGLLSSLFFKWHRVIFSLLGMLVLFFAYRWYMTKFMPSGALCLFTIAILAFTYKVYYDVRRGR
ncbi:MAG: TMEM14 family protein [Verrucomicrobia bacterium]|nr:TMEM14 family protein [Verrucomicrobiota bacterium]MBS0638177.1 TMEM14 family protein [Verrucomicrobiota bacterium]